MESRTALRASRESCRAIGDLIGLERRHRTRYDHYRSSSPQQHASWIDRTKGVERDTILADHNKIGRSGLLGNGVIRQVAGNLQSIGRLASDAMALNSAPSQPTQRKFLQLRRNLLCNQNALGVKVRPSGPRRKSDERRLKLIGLGGMMGSVRVA